jgi:hypothetical protein
MFRRMLAPCQQAAPCKRLNDAKRIRHLPINAERGWQSGNDDSGSMSAAAKPNSQSATVK